MQPTQPTLPSVQAATKVWTGQPGAWHAVFGSMLQRAAIVAPALWLTGTRQPRRLAWSTFAVVAAIEVVVLLEVRSQVKANAQPSP